MDEANKAPILLEMENLFRDLAEFYILVRDNYGEKYSKAISDEVKIKAGGLGISLGRKIGVRQQLITDLTALTTIADGRGGVHDVWNTALSSQPNTFTISMLSMCVTALNRAIGQLEGEINTGVRDPKSGRLLSPINTPNYEPPKAFISHGKSSPALDKLETFLLSLGVIPLIVKKEPSLDKTVDDKVEFYLNQADFVIILATGDDAFEEKLHP